MRIDSLHVLPSPRLILRSCAESLTLILSFLQGDDRALPPSAPLLSRREMTALCPPDPRPPHAGR